MSYFYFLIEYVKSSQSLLIALVSALATVAVDYIQRKKATKKKIGAKKTDDQSPKKRISDGIIRFVLIWAVLLISAGSTKFIEKSSENSTTPATPSPEMHAQTFPSVGEKVEFGVFKQTGETNNWSKDPITWIVLERDDEKALLISEHGLIYKPIQEDRAGDKSLEWNQSSLNSWFQNVFCTNSSYNVNGAFSEEELKAIIKTNEETYRIGLLSEIEAEEYFSGPEERKCSPTLYAGYICEHNPSSPKGKVPTPSYSGDYWWLCTSGKNDYTYMTVDNYGNIKKDGTFYDYSGIMVRPAVWISIEEYLKIQ